MIGDGCPGGGAQRSDLDGQAQWASIEQEEVKAEDDDGKKAGLLSLERTKQMLLRASSLKRSWRKKPGRRAESGRDDARDGPVVINGYTVIKVIGKGSFGKVLLVEKDGTPFALKCFGKRDIIDRGHLEHTLCERNIMYRFRGGQHSFVLGLECAFQTADRLFLVSEFCQGGELFYHLRREAVFTEDKIRFYGAETASALMFLHQHGICYRDLKAENIFLDRDGHIRLGDFGLSKEGVGELQGAKSICGTAAYIAPEMICNYGNVNSGYGRMVDWWTFGNLMYDMIAGCPPFYDEDLQRMCSRIVRDRLRFPRNVPMSRKLKHLISMLLRKNPVQRLGSKRLGGFDSIKNHLFFAEIDWDLLEKKQIAPPNFESNTKASLNSSLPSSSVRSLTLDKHCVVLKPNQIVLKLFRTCAPYTKAKIKTQNRENQSGEETESSVFGETHDVVLEQGSSNFDIANFDAEFTKLDPYAVLFCEPDSTLEQRKATTRKKSQEPENIAHIEGWDFNP